MNGLALSRAYFSSVAEQRLRVEFPDLFPRLAAGLVGNGSECFGYDDMQSRDHDWGVDFFLWVPEDARDAIPALHEFKLKVFDEQPPEFARTRSEYGARIGAMTVGDFYQSLIGCPQGPQTTVEWLRAPEENLAMAVNGEVFIDGTGEFAKIRERLLAFYPDDLRKKKIAAKCMAIAQTGQYNLDRIGRRGDIVTVNTVLARFTDSVIGMICLLNRVYKPYYKWAFRRMSELPILGGDMAALLRRLAEICGHDEAALTARREVVADICRLIVSELRRQWLAFSDDWFLTTHGEEIQRGIQDELLRGLPAQYE